ncbi:MAG: DUF2147 domain-containing protein [Croceibacterium sp.]
MKRSEGFLRFWTLPGSLLAQSWLVILFLLCMAVQLSRADAATPVTNEVWLMDARVAVQMFDCGDLLCGRIIWLVIPRDAQGVLRSDQHNPDTALRQRPLCGLTVLWALHPKGADRWEGGWFYNPDDGKTYRVSAKLTSADVITARVYRGIPIFGKTKTLQRVPHGKVEGWC